ncbi:MAG: ferritin-like domain-containing protein [Methylomonas sp.]
MNNLTETEIRALNEALDDEYRSFATYDQVIADFGEVPPFSNIREAEGRHIDALCVLFARYGLLVLENPWPGKVERYASLQDACEAGVAAEIANAEIYERLQQATARQDILTVFRNLHEASQQRHLPAFRRCAQGSVDGGCGGRAGQHRGWRGEHERHRLKKPAERSWHQT